MKKVLLVILSVVIINVLHAQLANTRWMCRLNISGPVNAIFDFKKDTVSLYTVADSTIIETMSYTTDGATITVKKIDGQSDCDNDSPGKYKIRIENDLLYFNLLQDPCDDRWNVLGTTKWKRWRDYTEVKVDNAVLQQYVGVYQPNPEHPITITLDNGKLYAEGPNNGLPKSPLLAVSNTKFFLRVAGVEWDFIKDASGKVISVISHEEKDYELKKVK